MNRCLNDILEEALGLNADERCALMVTLQDSLGTDSPASVASAWTEEITKRKLELQAGQTKRILWAVLKARIQAL